MGTQDMTKAQRDELRRQWEAATKGEWKANTFLVVATEHERRSIYGGKEICHTGCVSGSRGHHEEAIANAAFIAAAHNALPALLDQIDALERERGELMKRLRWAAEMLHHFSITLEAETPSDATLIAHARAFVKESDTEPRA